jgi:hypothetical protein
MTATPTSQAVARTEALFRNWRQLPSPDLAKRILEIQRTAIRHHLDEKKWRALDRMRKHAAEIAKGEAVFAQSAEAAS